MMGSEKQTWRNVKRFLDETPRTLHYQRIEDKLQTGIPDLNLAYHGHECWIEMKYLESFPKRRSTPIRIGLTKEQALWLKRRAAVGGSVFVLVQIAREYYMFWIRDALLVDQLQAGIDIDLFKQKGFTGAIALLFQHIFRWIEATKG
jgi:penicillin-binding protein-related factor A (putative recombinase)